jgi:DNA polymerase III subunit beta
MKVICKQQDLVRGISVVARAVSSRSTLPILANILMMSDQGRLKLSATDLEIGITCWVDADVQEEGCTTVSAKTFSELANSLRPGPVALSVPLEGSYTLAVKAVGVNANLNGMDPSEYPLVPGVEGGEQPLSLECGQVKKMINEVAYSASEDSSRPVFTAVHVEVKQGKMTFAAADSFRLATSDETIPGEDLSRDNILIPARTLEELVRILPSEGIVQITVTPNLSQVSFHTEGMDLVSRLVEGTFPNFRSIIKECRKGSRTRAVFETRELAAAIKAAMPFARDSANIIRLKVVPGSETEQGTIFVEATTEDVGSNVSTAGATVEGPEQQIIFNAKYLGEVLAVLVVDTPEAVLELASGSRPGLIKRLESENFQYIIMPMSRNNR